jgi:hypothetical protein
LILNISLFFKVPVRSFEMTYVEARSFNELRSQVDVFVRELVENNPLYRQLLAVKRNALLERVRQFNQQFDTRVSAENWSRQEVMEWAGYILSILNEVFRYQIEICALMRINAPNV